MAQNRLFRQKLIFALLLSVLCLTEFTCEAMATEYYVSLEGDDSNPGTFDKPWQHIQKAVDNLHPGDICVIMGGTYSEEVTISGLKGAPKKPIIFISHPGDKVVFDGTIPIQNKWTKHSGNIYVTTLKQDIWQLFVDGEMQVNARWPNAFWYDYSVFDYTLWGFSSDKSTYDEKTTTGFIVDNGTQNLAESGLNATGAIAILNIGSWLTWAGLVKHHKPGTNTFGYDLELDDDRPPNVAFKGVNSRYFLEDKLEFLDAPTEWFYDKESRKLYLWTKAGDSPETYEIRGKASTYAFIVTKNSSWLVFSKLNFFGTTMFIKGKSTHEDVDNIRLESLHFSYPSYSKRMLGSLAPPNTTMIYYNAPLIKSAGNFTIFNCTWEYADGQTIEYRGADGMFTNNLWHHNDFTCVGNGKLFMSDGVRDQFVRNVIHSNGPSVGFGPGSGGRKDRALGLPVSSTVKLNLFYDMKHLQNDGAHVQTRVAAQDGAVLEYNWGYDTLKWGLRFDCGTCNNTAESWGHNATMRYNVMWRTRGLSVKGDYQLVYNNLVFDSHLYADLFLRSNPGSGDGFIGENVHTTSTKNILQHGACPDRATTQCTYSIPGNYIDNTEGDVRQYLRDPDNLDFRPKQNSTLIFFGIGPYGKESMNRGGVYWIPGRQELVATNPVPPNGTMNAKCDADLMWLSGYLAEAHNVYFGTNETLVATSDTSSSVCLGQMKMPSNIQTPGVLKPATTYYWRVDAIASKQVQYTGGVWWFKCK